VKTVWNSGGT